MPKVTVQKYPQDETSLHTAIQALVDYFDQIAETARSLTDRDESGRATTGQFSSPYRSRRPHGWG
jgi:hypothetical protein